MTKTLLAALGLLLLAPAARAADGTVLLGLGKPADRSRQDFDYGPVLAGSVGGRVSDHVSLHGQLTLGFLDPDGADAEGNFLQAAFLPMIHLLGDRGDVDLILAPNLGVYRAWGEFDVVLVSGDIVEWGFEAGLQAAAFFSLSRALSLGMYFQFSHLFPQEVCVEIRNGPDDCDDDPDDEWSFLSFGVGLKF